MLEMRFTIYFVYEVYIESKSKFLSPVFISNIKQKQIKQDIMKISKTLTGINFRLKISRSVLQNLF